MRYVTYVTSHNCFYLHTLVLDRNWPEKCDNKAQVGYILRAQRMLPPMWPVNNSTGSPLTQGPKTLTVSPTEARPASQNGNHRTVEQLTRIRQEIHSIDSIRPDSSLAVQMFAQIEELFKVKLPRAASFFSVDSGSGCSLDFSRQGVM